MKISQYSRISHHTTTGTSSTTFTIPSNEDFTSGGWTIYDLALSEIGVNEPSGRSFIRIDDEVREFNLSSFYTATTIGTASSTLSTFSYPIFDNVKWVDAKIKSRSVDSNNYGFIADIYFGIRNDGTMSVKLVGNTYSVKSYGDFSSNPSVKVEAVGLTCSIIVVGTTGYTCSWSGNVSHG